jgi:hypothetical protein
VTPAAAPESVAATAAAAAEDDALPDGWLEVDDGFGNKYFANPNTNESSWTKPQREPASVAATAEPVAATAATAAAAAEDDTLPDGWLEVDDGSGNKYFANPNTNESSWTKPERVPVVPS